MTIFSIRFFKLPWLVCMALALVLSGCNKSADSNKAAIEIDKEKLASYQPLVDKLQEIFKAAYDPGPIALPQYEKFVEELAQAAKERDAFDATSRQDELKLEEMVAPMLAAHQSTLSAARNLENDSELVQKYRDGEKLEGNPELAEAVARAFPDGVPAPDELGAIGKFTAADAMIDVKWEHVRKTRAASQDFLDAFKKLKREASLTD